ncbi:alpha-L-fucosidase [Sulfuriroseicoccus oceanibius]|uniref:alpha-L-fucosidase n=1 Tax=Sulfuriroseicoccus oceanibius TaxID=2707525 RepID=A0A6B3LE39_9BACT|nr:alpha-L-fucosidase [Sulfuriroseicoccus oceanibius]QQL45103.1 alpha-L-fucosidase [Sulfuriroseicoccus oceanibius]
MRPVFSLFLAACSVFAGGPALAAEAPTHESNLEYFSDAKLGIFVHWNMSSLEAVADPALHPYTDPNSPWFGKGKDTLASGQYEKSKTGTEISWGRVGPRPGKKDNGVVIEDHYTSLPYAQYNRLWERFKPEKLDAEDWADLFRKSGAKYVVLVSKHHDGFPMFDAKRSLRLNEHGYPMVDHNGKAVIAEGQTADLGWKITGERGFGRDVIRELSDAIRKEGLKVGYYYSNPDWTHPNYNPPRGKADPTKGADYSPYMRHHLKQLLTEYGDVFCLWFDGLGGSHPSHWGGDAVYQEVRGYQPATLFNDRYYFSYGGKQQADHRGLEDFATHERKKGYFNTSNRWETCDIICRDHSWSYQNGNPVKPHSVLLTDIIDVVDSGGNFLLNLTPDGNGVLPADQREAITRIGEWMGRFGESVYGTTAGPYKPSGALSSSHRGKYVYLHVRTGLMVGPSFRVPGLEGNELRSAKLLHGGELEVARREGDYYLTLPAGEMLEPVIDCVVLEFAGRVDSTRFYELPSAGADYSAYGRILNDGAICTSADADPKWSPNPQQLMDLKSEQRFGFHSMEMESPSVLIDLRKVENVKHIAITNRADSHQERAAGLLVEYSTDGKTFHKLWQDDSKPENVPERWAIPVGSEKTGAFIPGKPLRYLRVSLPGKGRTLHLQHIAVVGE